MSVTIDDGDADIIVVLILMRVDGIRFTLTQGVDNLPSKNSHEYVKNR